MGRISIIKTSIPNCSLLFPFQLSGVDVLVVVVVVSVMTALLSLLWFLVICTHKPFLSMHGLVGPTHKDSHNFTQSPCAAGTGAATDGAREAGGASSCCHCPWPTRPRPWWRQRRRRQRWRPPPSPWLLLLLLLLLQRLSPPAGRRRWRCCCWHCRAAGGRGRAGRGAPCCGARRRSRGP